LQKWNKHKRKDIGIRGTVVREREEEKEALERTVERTLQNFGSSPLDYENCPLNIQSGKNLRSHQKNDRYRSVFKNLLL
jgi:hypothetical protein